MNYQDDPLPSSPESKLRARKRMMDYLAQRDHSEKEIRKKLNRFFCAEDINAAIEYGKEHRWIPDDENGQRALSEKFAQSLRRKAKGWLAINHKLQEKGLPPVARCTDDELEKAQGLLKNKCRTMDLSSLEVKAKAIRFLLSRGFDLETAKKAYTLLQKEK